MSWFSSFPPARRHRRRAGLPVLTCAGLAHTLAGCGPVPHTPPTPAEPLAANAAGAEVIRKPAGAPGVPAGTLDEKGNPVTIACATCHATKPADAAARLGTPLRNFHQGMVGQHGSLTCVSCHNPAAGYGSLRLADGTAVPYTEVLTLCAQCHGPQHRDFKHGAHGGMTGYWDLSSGGRTRNTCTDCHHPHAPKFPTVSPAAGPNDRFPAGAGHE